MAKDDSDEAEFHARLAEQHEQRKPGDNSGKNKREQHNASEQSLAGKFRAIKCKCRGNTEQKRNGHSSCRNQQAVPDRVPDCAIGKQKAIPLQG